MQVRRSFMEQITTLDNQKMAVMQELSKTQMLIAGMKAEMLSLDASKENFFTLRENEVLGRIHKLLNSSRDWLEETKTNFQQVHEFYETVKTFADAVAGVQKEVSALVADFGKEAGEIKQKLDAREADIAKLRKTLDIDQGAFKRDKKFFQEQKKELDQTRRLIASERASLKIAYRIMKEENGK